MRVTDLWKIKNKPTVSFELFPARNEKAQKKLVKVIDKLAALEPDFVSVTFGAGGSTRDGSFNLAAHLKNDKRLKVLPYFAGYGLGPEDIISVVNRYRDLGVDDLLVIRGDPPRQIEDFRPHPEALEHATDMLEFLKPRYELCLGAAGHPEGHIEAKSKEKDIEYLKLKVDNGAQFIIVNYFWDNRYFFEFIDRCSKIGIDVPIIPGIMPIFSEKIMRNLAALCGATITEQVEKGLADLPEDDKAALLDFGVQLATSQCKELIERGVPGLHIYTMDKSKSTARIVKQLRGEGLL